MDAMPDALVVADAAIVAEAPAPGAANRTVAPEMGAPPLLLTSTESGVPKAAATLAL